ncbi:MAG TPA: hypothetical protein VF184_03615 [Phycisphaeraceae bacterium]
MLDDLVMYGVLALIVIGSWIANAAKKYSQQQEERKRQLQRMLRDARQEGQADLDALTQRQRQDLQTITQQRMEISAQQPSSEPTNLTMAQRIARARAKAQYEERARQLRQAQQQQQQRPQTIPGLRTPPADLQAQARMRAQAQAAQRARQQQQELARRRALLQAQQEAQRRAQEQRRQQILRQQQTQQQALARRRQQERLSLERVAPPMSLVQPAKPKRPALRIGPITPQSLAQAVILKEILDPPLALRESPVANF